MTSLLAAPLTSQGKVIGSINIYTREARTFSDEEVGFVKVVAGQAAIAIQNARLMSETLDMKRTLEARKLIERAKGILQYKHNLTEEEAYLRLRNESRRLRRSMRDLAEAVILADDLNRKDGPLARSRCAKTARSCKFICTASCNAASLLRQWRVAACGLSNLFSAIRTS